MGRKVVWSGFEADAASGLQTDVCGAYETPTALALSTSGFFWNLWSCSNIAPLIFPTSMAGLQADVYVSIGITWVAALIALCLRMVARQLMRIKWWLDDYCSILAFVSRVFLTCVKLVTDKTSLYSFSRLDIALF